MNTREREEQITRELLTAIDERDDLTQRHLAERMGVALGLANAYLKRCIRKGLVKIKTVPANRYLYYLTPKGFAEKSRLTASYLQSSFHFYREAGQSCSDCYQRMRAAGHRSVVLVGISDLAEIAIIKAVENDIVVAGVHEPGTDKRAILKVPVWKNEIDRHRFDALMITDLHWPEKRYTELVQKYGQERVYMPGILSGI